jgi:RNA polymerase sigma-70 factor, ECF subfamily
MNEFGRLLEKAIPRLRRYAFALTRNMSRADDLVQDTLVRAIANQRCWQWGTNLRAWLFTIMHNQNVNVVRRSARESAAVELDDAWPGPTTATDPAAGLLLRDLDRAFAQISREQRQVILLVGLEGISYGEAARILDVPLGTIRSRLSRGRESLRTLMDLRDETEATSGAAITSARSNPKRFVPEFERTQNSRFAADVTSRHTGLQAAAISDCLQRRASAPPLSLPLRIGRPSRTGSCFPRVV